MCPETPPRLLFSSDGLLRGSPGLDLSIQFSCESWKVPFSPSGSSLTTRATWGCHEHTALWRLRRVPLWVLDLAKPDSCLGFVTFQASERTFSFVFVLSWDKFSLYNPGWPWTSDIPASASQVCLKTLSLKIKTKQKTFRALFSYKSWGDNWRASQRTLKMNEAVHENSSLRAASKHQPLGCCYEDHKLCIGTKHSAG